MQQVQRSAGFETILELNANRRDFYQFGHMGRLANGVLSGTFSDKFQTGEFHWNVAPGK